MFIEEEYCINLHVGGKIVRDPSVSRTLQDNLRVVWNDTSTIDMINYWVKHKEIDLYVEHEINIVVFVNDESMLAVACLQFGGDGNEGGEGGEVVGSKCSRGEGGEVEGEGGELLSVGEGSEVAEGLSGKGDDVAVNEGGESDGSGERGLGMKVMYLLDGDDEEELQEAMQKFEVEVSEEVDGEKLNYSVGREYDGNETEYFDSDDHGSILRSEDDHSIDVWRRRKTKVIVEHFEDNIGDHLKMKVGEIQRKGLKIAINDILPRVEHRNCVRHILSN
ncbi:hypothetical protein GOBAR_AA34199 [Gossypium barbadense]|uniref:Uncharacterized protein n=1 Tax=Gossypium barbadense TaxID=3634 RepID=A0A2P5W5Y1_GOSBA|nr:hypothetical protein GOBAR_AA34199 [Gossypium barbadense]